MSARRLAQRERAPSVPVPPLCRPMSEFDPSEPSLVHDRRRDRMLPWSPAFQRSYERTARELAPGVIDYDGLHLDGWMIVDDGIEAQPAEQLGRGNLIAHGACNRPTLVTVAPCVPLQRQRQPGAPILIEDDPCFLLSHLGDELRKHGTAARELLAIKFRSEDDHVIVVTRKQPLSERYPQLSEILDDIGRTCRDEGIGVEQLRRISFFEEEVNLETEDTSGDREVFTWPIMPRSLDS